MMSAMFMAVYLLFFSLILSTAHPISIGLILVGMALMGGGLLMKVSISWFFYLLVLVFLGGVMVIIIYMSTLASNEKLHMSAPFPDLFGSVLLIISGSSLLKFKVLSFTSAMGVVVSRSLYEASLMSSLIFLMVYLLLTLVCVVKLVKFEFGPLVARL